jgi:hypothetical protein
MVRPLKDPNLRMNIDLRIPITAEQKKRIIEAMADEPAGFAAWAREVLLTAASAKAKGHRHDAEKSGGNRRVS